MSNKIGGAGGPKGPEGLEALEAVSGGPGGGAIDASGGDGAPGALRTARPRSLDMGTLGLAATLAAKLDPPAASATGVAGPGAAKWPLDAAGIARALDQAFPGSTSEPTSGPDHWVLSRGGQPDAFIHFGKGNLTMECGGKTATTTLAKGDDVVAKLKQLGLEIGKIHPHDPLPPGGEVGGPGPRPHAGAAAARELEALIGKNDATALGGALLSKIQHLVTIDRRHGIQLNPNATPGEINTFKMMLTTLEADGKLDDLRRGLSGPNAGPRLVFGTVDDVMKTLLTAHGSKAQNKTWETAFNKPPVFPTTLPTPVTVSGAIRGGPAGPDPRPHAGAAHAKQLEALIGQNDATRLAGALYEKLQHLVTVDRREGIQLNQNATEGEINTFKVMLATLAADGKLDDLRQGLHGPSAGPRLVFGSVEDVMSKLVATYGTKDQQKAWGK